MPSSDYYWARHLVRGFGKMWFLIVPQEAGSSGGGASLLGSVVNELSGGLFPAGGGIIGRDFPEPHHVTTPQLLLKSLEHHRSDLGIPDNEQLVREIGFPGLTVSVDRKKSLKIGTGSFPSLPSAFSIDYSRMVSITIEFGVETRKKFIPTGYLSRLKDFLDGDDRKIATDINIDKETIVHQVLLTNQYSVTFESTAEFDSKFEAAVKSANAINAEKVTFELDNLSRRRVTAKVDDGHEYLIALKDLDWDDF